MLGTAPLSDAQPVSHTPRAPRKAIPDATPAPQAMRPPRHNVPAPAPPKPFVIERTTPAQPASMPRVRSFLVPLLALFALLNVGDLASTYLGLHNGMREGNPLMGALLAQYGFGALIVYKLLVIAAVTAGIVFLRAVHRRVANVTIWVCNVLVLLVVVANVAQYSSMR